MALAPIKGKWSQQLTADEETSFVVETTALTNVYFILNPVLIFHNPSNEDATLKITYTLDLGSGDDPLNSGTFTVDVVDETIAAGARYPYSFSGIQLDNDTQYLVTHEVTIKNIGLSTHVYHTLLTGYSEVQTQFPSANAFIRNNS